MRPLRRQVSLTVACVLAAPLRAFTQPGRIFRVGYVDNTIPLAVLTDPARRDGNTSAFVEALRERGWVEGRNLEILWRSVEGDYARRPAVFHDLVQRPVDVIVLFGDYATRDARTKTRSIPIVMVSSSDPLGQGHAASLARPSGNVTGLVSYVDGLGGKRLQLLKQAAPHVTQVGIVFGERPDDATVASSSRVAQSVGVKWAPVTILNTAMLEPAFAEAARRGVDAMSFGNFSVLNDPNNHNLIRGLVERYRLPVVQASMHEHNGAILNYGTDARAMHVSAAGYVDRILRGAKAGDLPIEQARVFKLWANKRAAKAIGLEIPASVVMLADRVIE